MLLKLSDLITKYNMQISGIVHVGAHYGEEYDEYISCGINDIVFVEPCAPAFSVLEDKFGNKNNVTLFHCALGARPGAGTMYVAKINEGQSNSLLKPKEHLTQWSNILFEDKEDVVVETLDHLDFDKSRFNLLYMDVQGYELEVLKGGEETLRNIDFIYTEVNRDEVYEDCVQIAQLDEFLNDFARVETNWGMNIQGDALYIRKSRE